MTIKAGALFTPKEGIVDLDQIHSWQNKWIPNPIIVMLGDLDENDDDDLEILKDVYALTTPHCESGRITDVDLYMSYVAQKKFLRLHDMVAKDKEDTEGFIKLQDSIEENQRISWVLIAGDNKPAVLIHWNGERCVRFGESRPVGQVSHT